MNKLSIINRITIAFVILILIMITQFIYSSIIENKKSNVLNGLHSAQSTSVQLSNMSVEGQKMRRYEKEYFIYVNNDEKRNNYFNQWQEAGENIAISLDGIKDNANKEWTNDDISVSQEWDKALKKYVSVMNSVNNQVLSKKITATLDANSAIADGKNAFRVYLNGTAESFNNKLTQTDDLLKNYDELNASSRLVNIILFIVGAIVAIIFVILLTKSINKQVKMITASINEMSTGDFDKPINKPSSPELLKIGTGIEMLRKSTKILLGQTDKTINELKELKELKAMNELRASRSMTK